MTSKNLNYLAINHGASWSKENSAASKAEIRQGSNLVPRYSIDRRLVLHSIWADFRSCLIFDRFDTIGLIRHINVFVRNVVTIVVVVCGVRAVVYPIGLSDIMLILWKLIESHQIERDLIECRTIGRQSTSNLAILVFHWHFLKEKLCEQRKIVMLKHGEYRLKKQNLS